MTWISNQTMLGLLARQGPFDKSGSNMTRSPCLKPDLALKEFSSRRRFNL